MIPFLRRRTRTERGAVAIMVAALSVVLFGVAALAVDVASQVDQKQDIRNQLDAAATAAAYYLDPGQDGLAEAADQAIAYYAKNGQGTLDQNDVDFWCVVAKDPTKDQPAWLQVPGVCNPDGIPTAAQFPKAAYQDQKRTWGDHRTFQMTCNTSMCAIPCGLDANPGNNWNPGNSDITASPIKGKPITCNTIRIGAARDVPFTFGKVIGVDKGSTGAQVAVACRGVCGQIAPNPMNVVVVTDRTGSMSDDDLSALVGGVKDMLKVMSPDQQYVSLGVIGRSSQTTRGSFTPCSGGSHGTDGTMGHSSNTGGLWVPLAFYKDYLKDDRSDVNPNSNLVKALNCLDPDSYSSVGKTNGTYLASPMKAAARYVLGLDSDNYNIPSPGNDPRIGTIRNVVIFETDGRPQPMSSGSNNCGTPALDVETAGCGDGYDILSNKDTLDHGPMGNAVDSTAAEVGSTYPSQSCPTGYKNSRNNNCYALTYKLRSATGTGISAGDRDCQNFIDVANNFKAEDPTNMVITVGFNLGDTSCGSDNGGTNIWLSDIQPASGSWGSGDGQQKSDCIANTNMDGSTPEEAMSVSTRTCKIPLNLTYSRITSTSTGHMVTETLAAGSGTQADGPGVDDSGDHCATADGREVENTDSDLFFCAASGDQMAAIFQTIASKLTTGVKLINLPM